MAILFETELDDTQFQAGLKNMEKGGKRVEGSLVGSFDSMAKGIGASMAAAFTVGAVVNAGKSVIDFAGQLQDQAEALGINTEVLQGFQGAMANSGVSAEKFTKGMATLISSIQQAKDGSGTARDSFEALGIEFDSIANDSPDEILLKIADGLKNAKDPAAAYAAALDIVGKNQINFVSALKGGREEFSETASTIKTASAEQVAAIARIGDAWDKAVTAAKTYGIEVLNDVLPKTQEQEDMEQARIRGLQKQTAAGQDVSKQLDALKEYKRLTEEMESKSLFSDRSETFNSQAKQREVLKDLGLDQYTNALGRVDKDKLSNDIDNLNKSASHLAGQKEKFGPDYTEKEQAAPLKPYSGMEDLLGKKEYKERGDMMRKLEAQAVTEKEKQEAADRKSQAEYADYEAATQKQANEDNDANQKKADAKVAAANKDAIRDKMEKAGQDLQQAQKVTAKAEKETVDARDSLQRALEGNPDARETGAQKQVKKMMDKLEKQLDEPEAKKRTGLGSSLDDEKKSTSSRRGTKKALEELKTAKDAEKAAKDAEDLIKEQQKDMVIALKQIDKGINGK